MTGTCDFKEEKIITVASTWTKGDSYSKGGAVANTMERKRKRT